MATMLRRLFFCALIALCVPVAVSAHAAVLEVGPQSLTKDTTWQGDILVAGDVEVPPGVTLTILPGTTVRFRRIASDSRANLFGTDPPYYARAEIVVTGRLLARGTAARPILFTSAEKEPEAGDWGTLNFLGGSGNELEQCRIEYAYNGIHAHGAQVRVKESTFANNVVAISVKKEDDPAAKATPGFGIPADLTVTGCTIRDNRGGINVRSSAALLVGNRIRNNKFFGIWIKEQCRGEIRGNEITANRKGIFFYKAQGMTIAGNNIYGNLDYNLAIADEQKEEIQAAGNWLGSSDPEVIEGLIFDGRADPSVARIVYQPFLKQRVK